MMIPVARALYVPTQGVSRRTINDERKDLARIKGVEALNDFVDPSFLCYMILGLLRWKY